MITCHNKLVNFELLEWLGDSVLKFFVRTSIFKNVDVHEPLNADRPTEGDLSELEQFLTCNDLTVDLKQHTFTNQLVTVSPA